MSRKVALIPEELVSSFQYQQTPELRLEDEIVSLLDRKKLPDDMKVKLLGQLVMRYQKAVHTPPEPIPVTIQNDQSSNEKKEEIFQNVQDSNENKKMQIREDVNNFDHFDDVMKDIIILTPHRFKKYAPMIVEKLKTRNYFWNSIGEMTIENKPIKGQVFSTSTQFS